jgi:phage terminase small subunit
MPRKSNADITLIRPRIDGRVSRLSPPSHLGAAQAKLFIAIINACTAEHFRPSDQPILIEYVVAATDCENAHNKMIATGGPVSADGEINPWFKVHEKLARRLAILATRLRLTPASRMRPEAVQRRKGYAPPSYYDREGED